ncbi:hypothetical protein D3C78_1149090 [compost metagenome]
MHPNLLLCSHLSNRAQWINRARIGRACGCHDCQNLLAVGIALGNFSGQIVQIHTRTIVGFHQDDRLIAQTQQRHILLHREVCIFRTQHADFAQIATQTVLLDRMTFGGKERIACQHQPHQIALGSAAGKYACIAGLIANTGTQPVDQLHFNNGR